MAPSHNCYGSFQGATGKLPVTPALIRAALRPVDSCRHRGQESLLIRRPLNYHIESYIFRYCADTMVGQAVLAAGSVVAGAVGGLLFNRYPSRRDYHLSFLNSFSSG